MNAISKSELKRCFFASVFCCVVLVCSGCASYFPTSEAEYYRAISEQKDPPRDVDSGPSFFGLHPGQTLYSK
jgi:hypothetical protein